MRIGLDEALDLTRTADVWLFRGRTLADRAVQVSTNSPVNHVGMSVVIDDLPPLMWHAELSRSLPDLWSGTRHRGAQLHDLRESVLRWATRYGQRVWLRQLDRPVTRDMEDAVLRTIARLDGTPFPSAARLASRWLRGAATASSCRRDPSSAARSPCTSLPTPLPRRRSPAPATERAGASARALLSPARPRARRGGCGAREPARRRCPDAGRTPSRRACGGSRGPACSTGPCGCRPPPGDRPRGRRRGR